MPKSCFHLKKETCGVQYKHVSCPGLWRGENKNIYNAGEEKNIYNFIAHTGSMTDNNACKVEVAFHYLKRINL